jgi:hypothetical protein
MKYLAFFLLSAMAVEQPTLPPLLEKALRGLPGLRLLDPSVDLVGGYTVNELKDFGFWPPWVVMDVDRDGRPDVVAVVVKPGATPEFGVIAVHARTPAIVRCIGMSTMYGVRTGRCLSVRYRTRSHEPKATSTPPLIRDGRSADR